MLDVGGLIAVPFAQRWHVFDLYPWLYSIFRKDFARIREGSPNQGEPNRDHVHFLANTNRTEQSFPMFGSSGCLVRQNTNRTEQMCPMFVFGSVRFVLVRYNVVSRIFRILGSLAGQSYRSLSDSQTITWKLVVYIPQSRVLSPISARFYLTHMIHRTSDCFPQIGRTKQTRTEQTFVVRLRNRTRTVHGGCSVRFGSVRRAHSGKDYPIVPGSCSYCYDSDTSQVIVTFLNWVFFLSAYNFLYCPGCWW